MADVVEDVKTTKIQTGVLKDVLAVVKIGIVNSNLITTFTGLWLALHFTGKGFLSNLHIVFFALIGSALVIAGSCALNNFIDRDIDHLMERTKNRPTVSGSMEPKRVLWFGVFLIAIGTLSLLMTTVTAAVIGLIGVVTYVFLYTMWSKRSNTFNTVIGSISGAVPPVIGWTAVDDSFHIVPVILFLLMFLWQPPHFLALAMKRCEEYRAAGIPMLPVVHGFAMTKRQIIIWIVALLPLPFYLFSLGVPFLVIATLLNVGWLALGLAGFKMKDDMKWAKWMFIYSLNYLTILFVTMVIVTID
ncbi:protoheme IX farnesyltransferase [Anoxybacillus flavithermus TNO-09.006]|uniref:Protoheme IX farnesyltransferase n=1 Tax=Anoxybacillus flavithermus TaxID=33934 RepID=A0A178TJ55_9BACL|nr:heme o synthase [Anoxybacillus flavithermus]ELK21430.1 protoheme IX farnesyltransferase [Anoxybacillus flavithermus TNO-09.006]MBE2928718.1 protoheme IX farnesyltransferase [Anoxybacillus flavithermus]MBE2955394.1 protoheme IX farnesyltransferase [Anoxybacillus flavithermus]OAO81389.1 Heme O synthase protoheme IX farnesyltransferase COX10-CtaB [Anoxybacillus flavithermus]